MKTKNASRMTIILVWIFIGFFPASASSDDFADKARKPVLEAIDIRQDTRKTEDQWVVEREKLKAKYDALEEKKIRLTDSNEKAVRELSEKTRKVEELKMQLVDVSRTSEEIEPFLRAVYLQLRSSVDEMPWFLYEERRKRLDSLGSIIENSQVNTSEKLRRLTEALMIEAEYGSTIEVYPERISLDGKDIQTRIFRLGRLALFCQSLDKKLAGYYNPADGKWTVLPRRHNSDINAAMEIGAKRRSADLLNLPLGRIEVR